MANMHPGSLSHTPSYYLCPDR